MRIKYKSNLKGLKVNFHLLCSFAHQDWFLKPQEGFCAKLSLLLTTNAIESLWLNRIYD